MITFSSTGDAFVFDTNIWEPSHAVQQRDPYPDTCKGCYLRGDRKRKPYGRKNVLGEFRWDETFESYRFDKFPIRCRKCERVKKRKDRMKRTLNRLSFFCIENAPPDKPWDKYAKMVTVTLPSEFDDSRRPEEQIKELFTAFTKFRRFYEKIGIIKGGTFNIEITSRINLLDPEIPWFAMKFHAHIHAVVCMPYLDSKNGTLQAFSQSGLKFGLGLVHVRGKPYDVPPWKYHLHLGNYIAKYITKSGRRASPFGKMFMGYKIPPVMIHYGQESNASKTNLQLLNRNALSNQWAYRRTRTHILSRSLAFCQYCQSQVNAPRKDGANQQHESSYDSSYFRCLA